MSQNPYTTLAHILARQAVREINQASAAGAMPAGQRAVPSTPAAGTVAPVDTSDRPHREPAGWPPLPGHFLTNQAEPRS